MEYKHDNFLADYMAKGRDASEACLIKGCLAENSISREYKKFHRNTMEHKSDRFKHLPTYHMGKRRDPSKVYHVMESSENNGVTQV